MAETVNQGWAAMKGADRSGERILVTVRGGDGEVGGGFRDFQTTRHVEIDVEPGEGDATTRLEHREDHRQSAAVPLDAGHAQRS